MDSLRRQRAPMRTTTRSSRRPSTPLRLLLMFVAFVSVTACSDAGTVTSETKLQEAPTAASKVLAVIPQGSAVKVGDCSNGWCRASFKGNDGFVLTKSVHLSERAFRATNEEPRGEDETEDAGSPPPEEPAPQSSTN
jgi:uncharacterized protein YraI